MPAVILTFGAGAIVAMAHLAGLWLSVRQVCRGRQLTAWFAMSMLLRVALVAAALCVIGVLGADGDPMRLLAALAGFVSARVVILRRVRRGLTTVVAPGEESR